MDYNSHFSGITGRRFAGWTHGLGSVSGMWTASTTGSGKLGEHDRGHDYGEERRLPLPLLRNLRRNLAQGLLSRSPMRLIRSWHDEALDDFASCDSDVDMNLDQ